MRILLDECIHAGVRAAFPGHSVSTVSEAAWRSSKDNTLPGLAEREFDVSVTIDRKLEHQIDLRRFALAFVMVRVAATPSQRIFRALISCSERWRQCARAK